MRAAFVVIATAGWIGCSPYGGGAYFCEMDSQCSSQGVNGTCQSNGYCSFPSADCPSGQRYGGLAAEDSNLCVGLPATGDDGGLTIQLDASQIDAAPSAACFGNGTMPFVRECLMAMPSTALDLGNRTIDTNANSADCAMVVAGGNLDACVIAGSSIRINGVVSAHGSRPLVLVSVSTIVVDGTIDVASHRGGQLGPSANTTPCPSGISATDGFFHFGAGGYGGSFAGKGGKGGRSTDGGNGGVAPNAMVPPMLRGGCPGSNGAAMPGGTRGDGGGAVALIARGSITINGTINASGGGGGAGANLSGGGGGGAGGMIELDAPTITITATGAVFANGGGGGEGGGGGTANPGAESTDGSVAKGGAGGAKDGGDGGNGAQGTMLNGSSGHDGKAGNSAGGGGGGGGVGVIRQFGTSSNQGLISPPAS